MKNPASRELLLAGEKIQNNFISSHQVSHDLLLYQIHHKEIKNPKNEHSWFLWYTNGTFASLSEELDRLLHEENWQAQSVSSRAGHLTLTLVASHDQKVVRITEVELDSQANICHLRD